VPPLIKFSASVPGRVASKGCKWISNKHSCRFWSCLWRWWKTI